ncbi:hypothetical protein FACS1894187_17630 [Synergistales bacterium]|nr:hypothetical protein FACS1894187_17630 [Synergistales bacterium]
MAKELDKKQERDTAQIFDLILKQLIRLSSAAVIQFINGLFGTNQGRIRGKVGRKRCELDCKHEEVQL